MIEYIISIGLNDRETYQQEIETEAARRGKNKRDRAFIRSMTPARRAPH